MHRFSFSSTASEKRARRNRVWMILGAVLVVLVILTAALTIWLPRRHVVNPHDCLSVRDQSQRFDCHPDRPVVRSACESRGCCFSFASNSTVEDEDLISSSFLGVPRCFFPYNYNGYIVTKNKLVKNSVEAELKRKTPSGFKDAQKIALKVIPIDDYRLRIQILDINSKPYEPGVPDLNFEIKEKRNESYEVEFNTRGILQVKRKTTSQPVFRADLSRLIFSEQFLQLSTEIPSKYIYGLGEQKEGILKSTNWTRYTLFNQGDLPVPHRNLYGSHPFYMVMEPEGLASGVFLLNYNAMDYVLQPTPAVTIRTIGGIFDFFLFLGPSPGHVVSQYTSLFGRPNFPPRWSLGFQICRYGYNSLQKTVETLDRNLDAGIPIDVQWHDIDYMDHHLDFTYDAVNFKGLPDFVEKLHKDGRHYVAMISPGLSNSEKPGTYPAYDEAKQLDLFIKDTAGNDIEGKVWNNNMTVYLDFSNPLTADYWLKQFEVFHSQLHFDGVWLDMNEPLNFLNGSNKGCPPSKYDNPPYLPGRPYPLNTLTLCMSAKHNRTEHYNEHNLLAYRESKATHIAMTNITGKRPFIISRASFAGQGVYSGHWSGDITSNWDDLRYTIPAMLAFSLYGMPMTGSDICGFRLDTTEELCARWHALGAFYPLSRNHNDNTTIEQDPVAMGPTVVKAAKNALKKRYYLLPYLYTLFYRNHVFGETVARPLFFEFPRDNETYSIEDEFMWGPALLIMPALHPGVDTINPYFPNGTWYDMDTKLPRTSSGERIKLKADITDINVAIRGGYVLPAQPPGKTTTDSALKPFHLLVALDSEMKAKGELFWDDGELVGTVENEKYNLVEFSVEQNALKVTPQKKGFPGNMALESIIVFYLTSTVTSVTINGHPVDFEFEEHVLRIKVTSYTLLDDLYVVWI